MSLYLKFVGLNLKAALQYKISFVFTAVAQFIVSFNSFLGIAFIFDRFQRIKSYSYSEVLLCFSVMLMSFSIAEMFMRGFDTFSKTISNGEFDRILVRPRAIVWQIVCSRMEFTRIGRLIQAVIILVYALSMSEIDWNTMKILTLLLMILGGLIIFSCLIVIYAGFCFFTIEGLEFMNIFTHGAREHGKYPIDIYGKKVLKFCTYIVPYTLFQYYPFLYLTGRTDRVWYAFLPLIGSLFTIPSYLFWRFGIRHYKSTGS